MKNTKKIMLVITVIAMTLIPNLLFAQDSTTTDDKAVVKDYFGRSTGLTKSGLAKHKQEYETKAKKQGIDSKIPLRYAAKVNLNALEEFKKIGIELVEMSHKYKGDFNYKENSLKSQVVIHGEVLKLEYELNEKCVYHSKYYIKVKEVLKGLDFFEILPDTVMALIGTGEITYQDKKDFVYYPSETQLNKGDEVILFLTKEYIRLQIEDKGGRIFPDYIFKPTTFYKFDDLIIKDGFVLPSDFLYGGENPKSQQPIKAEAIMDTIKMIDKINANKNFYKLKF